MRKEVRPCMSRKGTFNGSVFRGPGKKVKLEEAQIADWRPAGWIRNCRMLGRLSSQCEQCECIPSRPAPHWSEPLFLMHPMHLMRVLARCASIRPFAERVHLPFSLRSPVVAAQAKPSQHYPVGVKSGEVLPIKRASYHVTR